ncbi:hypothetical protein N9414_18603 [Nodularia spumigena CCY9414]|nr:hypothetical protein N9414_18603 [Nodularia spumigena CCY9414]
MKGFWTCVQTSPLLLPKGDATRKQPEGLGVRFDILFHVLAKKIGRKKPTPKPDI